MFSKILGKPIARLPPYMRACLSDPTKGQFGWYQRKGGNFHISIRQILHAEESPCLSSLKGQASVSSSEMYAPDISHLNEPSPIASIPELSCLLEFSSGVRLDDLWQN